MPASFVVTRMGHWYLLVKLNEVTLGKIRHAKLQYSMNSEGVTFSKATLVGDRSGGVWWEFRS